MLPKTLYPGQRLRVIPSTELMYESHHKVHIGSIVIFAGFEDVPYLKGVRLVACKVNKGDLIDNRFFKLHDCRGLLPDESGRDFFDCELELVEDEDDHDLFI